jgi:hypothetical protein
MGSAVSRYGQAVSELESAKGKVARIAKLATEVGSALRQSPFKVMVANTSGGFPPEVALAPEFTLNAREWPDAETLTKAVQALHEATDAARKAYAAIPDDEKSSVPSRH